MTKQEYLLFQEQFFKRAMDITKKKNADYTGESADPFANFSICQHLGICPVEMGFLVRMTDKLSRVTSFAQKGELQVKDESVTDTLTDLANYSCLLAGYLASKKAVVDQQTAFQLVKP